MVSGCLNKQHSTGLCDGRRWRSQWNIFFAKKSVQRNRRWNPPSPGLPPLQLTGVTFDKVVKDDDTQRVWEPRCCDVKRCEGSEEWWLFHHVFCGTHVGRSSSSALTGWMSARNLPKLLSISSNQVFWTLLFHVTYELLQLLQHDYLHPACRLNSFHQFPWGRNLHLGSSQEMKYEFRRAKIWFGTIDLKKIAGNPWIIWEI